MGCLHRLHGLRRMIGEISPRFLWELRCYSHAAHQPRHRRHQLTMQQAMDFAGSLWRWDFPSDLEGEGWMADLALAEAANGSGIVAPFLRHLGQLNKVGPIKGLALYIHAAKQQGRLDALPDAFVSGFRSSLQRLIFRVMSPSRQLPAAADLQPILRGLVILRDGHAAEQIRRRIHYWTEPAGQLALLGYLAAHGLSAARADLIALAQQPARGFTGGNISQQAWRAALAAPQSDALAFTDTTEQDFFL